MDFTDVAIAMDPGLYTLNPNDGTTAMDTALYIRASDPTAAQIDMNHELPTQSSVQDTKHKPSHGITRFFASSSLFCDNVLSYVLLTWIMTSCLPVMANFFSCQLHTNLGYPI